MYGLLPGLGLGLYDDSARLTSDLGGTPSATPGRDLHKEGFANSLRHPTQVFVIAAAAVNLSHVFG